MPHYIQTDGPSIEERGREAVREPHPVFLMQSDAPFSVSTNEGTLNGNAGDYVAYDPQSGHLWPVSAEYVDMHYVFGDEGGQLPSLEREATLNQRVNDLETEHAKLEAQNTELTQLLSQYQTAQQEAETQQAEQVAETAQTQEAEPTVQDKPAKGKA